MKRYAELGHVHRTEPCEEYPGEWLSYREGGDERSFPTFQAAYNDALARNEIDGAKTSVCWCASNNDPRIGEVWFTGFYQHGYFDLFGRYRQS